MARPVLYMEIVGTLLLDKGGRLDVAPFARKFIEGVKERFDLRLLTSLQEHQAAAVARALEMPISYVPYPRALGKASAIDFREDFYWLEQDPTPADLLRLSDERRSDRLIPVNKRDGVTEAVLNKLLNVLKGPESTLEAASLH